jgi:hypothetical protein
MFAMDGELYGAQSDAARSNLSAERRGSGIDMKRVATSTLIRCFIRILYIPEAFFSYFSARWFLVKKIR